MLVARFFTSWILIFLSILLRASTTDLNHNSTYKVFRIFPQTWKDVQSISALATIAEDDQIDFWLEARKPGQFADVMVSPRIQKAVLEWLLQKNLNFRVTINDVEKLIYQHENSPKSILKSKYQTTKHKENIFDGSKRLKDSPIEENADGIFFGERPFEFLRKVKGFNYPFGEYTNYATMLRFMRTVEFYYPHIAKLVRIGTTHEGRPIEGLKIGYHFSNSTKRVVWIDGNIHAREHASSHTALFVINQLVGSYGKDPLITHYMNHLNFVVVPCLNPDGYEYSRSSMNPEIRLWRKNRSPEKCTSSKWGGIRCCQGVDLNRNFDFHWAETGSSSNPCSNLYAGESPFSEPESKAVRNLLTTPEYARKVDAFITLHTYAQLFIYPFSHEVEYYPNDVNKLMNVAQRAVNRLQEIYGTQYRIGTGADLLSPAAGGSDDWAKESLQVKYVYLLELRPQLELSRGFILDKSELLPTAIETFEAIKVVIEQVLEDNEIKPRPKIRSKQFEVATPKIHDVATQTVQDKLTNGRFPNIPDVQPNAFVVDPQTGWLKATLNVETTKLPTEETSFVEITTTTTASTTSETTTTTTPVTTTTRTTPTTTPSTTTTQTTSTAPETTISTTTQGTSKATTSVSSEATTKGSSTLSSSENLSKHLTQELLRKQYLRIQALKSIKENLRQRLLSTQNPPIATRLPAPRFLTPSSISLEATTSGIKKTTEMPLAPLVAQNGSRSNPIQQCLDKKYSCPFWIKAQNHVCEDQKRFMQLNCAKSCKFC